MGLLSRNAFIAQTLFRLLWHAAHCEGRSRAQVDEKCLGGSPGLDIPGVDVREADSGCSRLRVDEAVVKMVVQGTNCHQSQ